MYKLKSILLFLLVMSAIVSVVSESEELTEAQKQERLDYVRELQDQGISFYVNDQVERGTISDIRDLTYRWGTEVKFVLKPREAVYLRTEKNSAGIEDIFMWVGRDRFFRTEEDVLHLAYETEEDGCTVTSVSEGEEGYRVTGTATSQSEWHYSWRREKGAAAVTFSARILSEEDLRDLVASWEREREEERKSWKPLEWESTPPGTTVEIEYEDPDHPKMKELRARIGLGQDVAHELDEYDLLFELLRWGNSRWLHHGGNVPSKSDPLTILDEAEGGQRFRCVEYAIVVAACARAYGMPSRVLALKRADAETAESGAGHVVAEVWLRQFDKWVFVDGQWGIVPVLRGKPLNAVEFQRALAENAGEVALRWVEERDKFRYFDWIYPYLFYFDFNEDQRFFGKAYESEKRRYDPIGRKIMLVPRGADQPKVFQKKTPIKNCVYVSNPNAFYPKAGK
jgi:transglutaminase-like putative cysteine protease